MTERRPDWSKILPGIKPTEETVELAAHKSDGKPLVGDIDPELELAIGHILSASVGKYPNDADGMPNWWKGGSYRGFAASIKRHMAAWLSGEEWDKESHMPHLWHAATDLMFLLSWQNRGVGQDDRLKEQSITGISHEPIHRLPRVNRSIPPMGD